MESESAKQEKLDYQERVDAIVRVDANALLKTIRDLEYRLSENTRPDKAPAWALAMELRIAHLEQNGNAFDAKSPSSTSRRGSFKVDPVPEEAPDSIAEAGLSPLPAAPVSWPVVADRPRNVTELASEMRLMQKVRKEVENKFSTAEITLESKISGFNLQLDRLHKLLQIRPTTSELQTVMNAVRDVEQHVKSSLSVIKGDVINSLRDRVSEELVLIIEDLTASKSLNDSGMKAIRDTVDGYASDMTDIRESTENTVFILNEEMDVLRRRNQQMQDALDQTKNQLDRDLMMQNGQITELKIEQRMLADQVGVHKRVTAEELALMEVSMTEGLEEGRAGQAKLTSGLAKSDATLADTGRQLRDLIGRYDGEMGNVQKHLSQLNLDLVDHLEKLTALRAGLDGVVGADYTKQIKEADAAIKKTTSDLALLTMTVDTYIHGELQGISVKIALLQEQCNIQIPNAYGDMSLRVDQLGEQLGSSNLSIEQVKGQMQLSDDTINELIPLLDRVSMEEQNSQETSRELKAMKESITNGIDTADELVRRLEDMEETLEGVDGSVANRMNQMREALIDTLLEKQSETNSAMRNVRENLEVMAQAGDGGGMGMGGMGMGGMGMGGMGSMGMGQGGQGGQGGQVGMSNKPMQSGKPSQASERVSVRDPGAGQVNVQTNVGGGGRPHRSTGGVHNNSSRHSSVSMRGEEQLGDFDHGDDEESYSQSRRTSAAGMPARPTGALHGHQLVGVPPPMAITRQSSVKGVSIVGGGAGTARPSVVGGGSVVSAGSVVSTGGGGGGGALARHSSHQQAGGLVGAYGRPVAEVRKPSTHHHHHHYISPGTPDDDMHGGSVAGQGVAEEVQFQDEVDSPGAPGSTGQRERRVVTMKQEHVQSFPHQASDYSNAMEGSYGGGQRVAFPHHQQSQFLADLALNFEEISVKRKRVAQVPSVICESIADVTQEVADFMARAADFDMVQTTLAQVAGLAAAQELQYDENLVLKRRTEKIEEFLGSMAHLVIVSDRQNPGMVRLDARSLFLSLVKKSLDMFMSKHNQVLVVGNSRLGRVKIPSCLACDRPLIDKVRLDSAAGRGLRGGGPLTSSSMSALPPPGRALAAPSQASYGYGAPADAGPAGGSALYRWGDSDDEDAPATHSGGQKELVADLQQVMRSTAKKSPNSPPKGGLSGLKKATKLPEVQ